MYQSVHVQGARICTTSTPHARLERVVRTVIVSVHMLCRTGIRVGVRKDGLGDKDYYEILLRSNCVSSCVLRCIRRGNEPFGCSKIPWSRYEISQNVRRRNIQRRSHRKMHLRLPHRCWGWCYWYRWKSRSNVQLLFPCLPIRVFVRSVEGSFGWQLSEVIREEVLCFSWGRRMPRYVGGRKDIMREVHVSVGLLRVLSSWWTRVIWGSGLVISKGECVRCG